ncbi:MAG: hypothetical protein IJ695_10285 [Butyrivibrio sp.]|nr:hypothetical protein [Butyrivibrio sp.]
MKVNYEVSDNTDMEDIYMEKLMHIFVAVAIVDAVVMGVGTIVGIAMLMHLDRIQFMIEYLSR